MVDHSVYEGNFKDGKYNGIGIYKNKKYIYKGEFICGKKCGKGKLENLVDKSIYKGEFKNDLKDGYGIEKYIDGSIYKGFFKEGYKEGKGTLIIREKNNNNYIYKGEFKKNKLWGKGRFKWNNKKEYYEEWNNNKISGFGVLTEDNVIHIGFFIHDKKEGYWVNFYTDKSFVLIGNWENDIIEGISIIYSLNNLEINNKENINRDERIVIINNGNIENIKLNEDDIIKIKSKKEYIEEIELYNNKFFPQYFNIINNIQKNNKMIFEEK